MNSPAKDNSRKRAPNFTVREKTLLLNIIHNYKHVIENKQTNATTWREKDNACVKIAKTFNSQNGETYYRAKENLKKYYENIKKTVRKEVATEKKEINKTGGGVFILKSDPVRDLTLNLVNKKTVYGFNNIYDGDSKIKGRTSKLNNEVNMEILEEEHESAFEFEKEHSNTSNDHDYGKSTNEHDYEKSITEHDYGKSTKEKNRKDIFQESSFLRDRSSNKQEHFNSEEPIQDIVSHVSQPKTPSLRHKWTQRRRPAPQVNSSLEVNKQQIKSAIAKQKCYEAELINIEARREQEKKLFELQKEKIMLEIELKKLELNKLQNSY